MREESADRLPDAEALLLHMRRLDRRVIDLTAALERSERLATIGLAAAMAAHEISNLLTPVIATASAATNAPADTDLARKAATRSLRQCARAVEMSQRLLALAGADIVPAMREPGEGADLSAAINEAIASLPETPASQGVEIRVEAPQGLRVRIPPVDLHQVFLNLLLNATAAMGPRGGSITIRVCDAEGGQGGCSTWNTARIQVIDTGPGMPTETLERIFEPFSTRARGGSGTGLGLTVCRHLIEHAGGQICVTSRQGCGTTFHVELPVDREAARQVA